MIHISFSREMQNRARLISLCLSLFEYIHEVTCTEGKNRQIRNVFAALGCTLLLYIIERVNFNQWRGIVIFYANKISVSFDS